MNWNLHVVTERELFFFQFYENGGNADHAPCRGAEGEKKKIINSWEAAG